jgi:RING finger protein 113A
MSCDDFAFPCVSFTQSTIKMTDSTSNLEAISDKSEPITFFKKRSTNKNIRKRKAPTTRRKEESDQDDSDQDQIESQVVTKDRKTGSNPFVQSTRKKRNRHDGDDAEDEEQDALFGGQYSADKSTTLQKSDATRYDTEWELQAQEATKKMAGPKKDVMNAKMQVGPQRAPANLRATTRFDYQPDVCKDYKGRIEGVIL